MGYTVKGSTPVGAVGRRFEEASDAVQWLRDALDKRFANVSLTDEDTGKVLEGPDLSSWLADLDWNERNA